jgi:hypothetical protein
MGHILTRLTASAFWLPRHPTQTTKKPRPDPGGVFHLEDTRMKFPKGKMAAMGKPMKAKPMFGKEPANPMAGTAPELPSIPKAPRRGNPGSNLGKVMGGRKKAY